jgi:hypothetical protein
VRLNSVASVAISESTSRTPATRDEGTDRAGPSPSREAKGTAVLARETAPSEIAPNPNISFRLSKNSDPVITQAGRTENTIRGTVYRSSGTITSSQTNSSRERDFWDREELPNPKVSIAISTNNHIWPTTDRHRLALKSLDPTFLSENPWPSAMGSSQFATLVPRLG